MIVDGLMFLTKIFVMTRFSLIQCIRTADAMHTSKTPYHANPTAFNTKNETVANPHPVAACKFIVHKTAQIKGI